MNHQVIAIGAANVDVLGFTEKPLLMGDSNPGRIETCLGGVSRNVSENLVKLGVSVSLITALGTDANGLRIRKECEALGISLGHSQILPGKNSSSYLAIMDERGEMALALSDMSILEELSVNHLMKHQEVLTAAEILVIDAGLTTTVMEWLVNTYPEKKIILDPVSVGKCRRMKAITGTFYCIKMNRLEAGFLTGINIQGQQDLDHAARVLLQSGVQKVYITLGAEGVYFQQEGESGRLSVPPLTPVNATGAGDAFTAAVVLGELKGWSMEETAQFAVAAAAVALMSRHTVSERMSEDSVRHWIQKHAGKE